MPGNVGQALLRDAVDGELGVGLEVGQGLVEPALDGDAGYAAEGRRQLGERADETELLEHFGAQLTRYPPHFVEGSPNRLLGVIDLVSVGRGLVGDRVQVQQDAGQYLADLVVEVAGDADAFGLLRGQDAAATLLPFAFEAVEHAVEGDDDAADLVLAKDLEPLTGP